MSTDVRSLYDLCSSGENVVEFVALAEFDIDLGAVVRARVPDTGGADSQYLSEQMLPDRSEGYSEQRVTFFMNRADEAAATAPPTPSERESALPTSPVAPAAPTTAEVCSLNALTYRFNPTSGEWVRLGKLAEESVHFGFVDPDSQMQKAPRNRTTCELFIRGGGSGSAEEPLHSLVITPQVGVEETRSPACSPCGERPAMFALSDTGCGFQLGIALPGSPAALPATPQPASPTEAPTADTPTDAEVFRMWLQGKRAFRQAPPPPATPPAVVAPRLAGQGGAAASHPWGVCTPETPFLYCLSITKRRHDPSVRRGAVMKGISIGCRNPVALGAFEPILDAALDRCLGLKEGGVPVLQREIVQEVYTRLNDREALQLGAGGGLPEHLREVSPAKFNVWKHVIRKEEKVVHSPEVSLRLPEDQAGGVSDSAGEAQPVERGEVQFRAKLPLYSSDLAVAEAAGRLSMFLEVFREASLSIVNEMMLGRRVVFLSYKKSAGDLCKVVMAVASLVIPLTRGYLQSRTFPYSSLTCMSAWMHLKSCLVGTTNPMFEQRTEWWDVLCNVDTGKVKFGKSLAANPKEKEPEADLSFLTKMLQSYSSRAEEDVEPYLRYHFSEYLASMRREGADTEAVQRVKRWRISGLLQFQASLVPACIQSARQSLQKLRSGAALTEDDAILIFQSLVKTVREQGDLMHLLSLMPREADGLFPIALGLFHPSYAVKLPCVAFLRRLDTFPEGKLTMHSLNPFLLLAYERNAKLMPTT